MRRIPVLTLTFLLALFGLTTAPQAAAYTFQTFDAGTSSYTFPFGINNDGQVSGYYTDSSGTHGFVRSADGSQITKFDYSGANETYGQTLNDSGEVAGYYVGNNGTHGFVRSADGTQFTLVEYQTDPNQTYAFGINNSGVVSGYFWDPAYFVCQGFTGSAGSSQFTAVDYPSAVFTEALGINNSGAITGYYLGTTVNYHGFVRSAGGSFTSFDYPSAYSTYAMGMNTSGQVAGYFVNSSDPDALNQGFVRSADGSVFTTVSYPSAVETVVCGINDSGLITGYYTDASDITHGFIATPGQTFSLSGTVTAGKSPLAGATVSVTGAASASTQTASNGTYSIPGLPAGSYTVTASTAGYAFKPQQVTITNQNVTNVNFSGTVAYSISGTVTVSGSPLAGVTITLTGASKAVATTGSDGTYSFTGLAAGSYTLTPSMTGYIFTPTSMKVTLNKNLTGRNFTATVVPKYSISGKVTVSGQPLANATVTLSGAAQAVTTTGSNGSFSFSGLVKGSYTLTPSMSGYTFSPKKVAINNKNVTNVILTGKKN